MGGLERTIRLYRELKGRRYPVSAQQLAEILECSERNVKKIIEKMRRLDAPLIYDREYRGYYLDPDSNQFELPGVWFNASELYALLASYQLLSGVQPGWLEDYIEPLKAGIEKLLGDAAHGFTEIQRRVRILQMGARPTELSHFQTISAALIQRRRLKILYHGRASDQTTEREISPQRLVYYRSNWYLDAWCHLRNGLRSFSIDRLHPVATLDEPAREIEDRILDDHYAQAYGIFAGPADNIAHLIFSSSAAKWVADEHWHPQAQSNTLADGRCELKIPYGDPTELIMDIMKYGPEVEVLAPPALCVAIAERARKMAQLYAK